MAASFSGCWLATSVAMLAPKSTTWRMDSTRNSGSATRIIVFDSSTWRFFSR